MKTLNVLQTCKETQIFTVSFTPLEFETVYRLSIWQCCKDSRILVLVSQLFEFTSHLVYSIHKRAH